MSAFGYFGSKLRIAAKMCDRLPLHSCWVELFCGSAAMTLAKLPAPIEVINDINGEIFNFYQQLRDHGDDLLRKIELTPYARAELELSRRSTGRISKLERARRFFVAAMMAVNGSFGAAKGGFSFSNSYSRNWLEARVNRWNSMPEYLIAVVERLKKARIENKDAVDLLDEFSDRPATLMYLDPPYFGRRVKGYDHDANSEEFHEGLLNAARKAKCMVFISGYDSDLYNDLLTKRDGWRRETLEAITKGNNGKCFARSEVIWFNQVYLEAKMAGRIPISLTEKEQKDRKVNPTRRRVAR
jgi:DNA adenine methylase